MFIVQDFHGHPTGSPLINSTLTNMSLFRFARSLAGDDVAFPGYFFPSYDFNEIQIGKQFPP